MGSFMQVGYKSDSHVAIGEGVKRGGPFGKTGKGSVNFPLKGKKLKAKLSLPVTVAAQSKA
jgi:hypothetical protein